MAPFRFASAKVELFFVLPKYFAFFSQKIAFFLQNRAENHKKEENICFFAHLTLILQRKRKVAQLVAHYVRDVGVGRSSRLFPTARMVTWATTLVAILFL